MSLVYDKGKHRHSTDKNSSKIKTNNNNPINQINNTKNINKKNMTKNNHIFNEYISSSPFEYNNKKKKQFLTTFQNMKENNQDNNNENIINNKRPQIKKLNFNKSFEGNITKNIDFLKEGIFKGKNNENKKAVNKSVIINHKDKIKNKNKKNNKSISGIINTHNTLNHQKNNITENLLIKKLEEKFKSLENNIIDKKYENEIDHEEMIISTLKNNIFANTSRINEKGKNIIQLNKLGNLIDIEENSDDHFMNIFLEKFILNNEIEFDEEYLLNSSFENNKNDFNIMYTDNYGESVMNDVLSLEIKLLIEKMLEIQKSYHKELDLIIGKNSYNSKMVKLLVKKIKNLKKKIFLLKQIKEGKEIKENIYNFLDIYNPKNQNEVNNLYTVNKNEFNLWNNILFNYNQKNKKDKKEKLKEIFKKVVFERYYKIKGKINNIENKIILNLMKKYNYNIKRKANGIKSNNINSNDFSTNQRLNKNKNMNNINKSKKVVNNNLNKKKHKKTSSCVQAKPAKYTYFKNNQKPK